MCALARRVLQRRLVALVRLWQLWQQRALALVLIGAVTIYPALGREAPRCAYPVKWGPGVLLLKRIGGVLGVLMLGLV